jgi:hypothetical protein
MTEVQIPRGSLERLRANYAQFEQLAAVVAEAMGLQNVQSINLPKGIFVVQDGEPAPTPGLDPEHANGVAYAS